MNLRLLSVNTGRARFVGLFEGARVVSAIAKQPIRGKARVGALGIEGDEQADLRVHGGHDKAVYAYPADNWDWWRREHGLACVPGTFGENLTVECANEDVVRIGDRFRWGDVLLEVSQPRGPCYKLGLHLGRAEVPQAMTLSAMCGWYLRVIEAGEAPAADAVLVRVGDSRGPSVREAFRARHGMCGAALLRTVFEAPALAESWRRAVGRWLEAQRTAQ